MLQLFFLNFIWKELEQDWREGDVIPIFSLKHSSLYLYSQQIPGVFYYNNARHCFENSQNSIDFNFRSCCLQFAWEKKKLALYNGYRRTCHPPFGHPLYSLRPRYQPPSGMLLLCLSLSCWWWLLIGKSELIMSPWNHEKMEDSLLASP